MVCIGWEHSIHKFSDFLFEFSDETAFDVATIHVQNQFELVRWDTVELHPVCTIYFVLHLTQHGNSTCSWGEDCSHIHSSKYTLTITVVSCHYQSTMSCTYSSVLEVMYPIIQVRSDGTSVFIGFTMCTTPASL